MIHYTYILCHLTDTTSINPGLCFPNASEAYVHHGVNGNNGATINLRLQCFWETQRLEIVMCNMVEICECYCII